MTLKRQVTVLQFSQRMGCRRKKRASRRSETLRETCRSGLLQTASNCEAYQTWCVRSYLAGRYIQEDLKEYPTQMVCQENLVRIGYCIPCLNQSRK